jgi:Fur family transcriptional regulator, ferric uptake regulator
MNETIYLKKLEQREIKPTAIRLLILKTMMQHKEAFSLLDLENELDTVDKSTIYRTITLFLAHHLIHGIDDGTGSLYITVAVSGRTSNNALMSLRALCTALCWNHSPMR